MSRKRTFVDANVLIAAFRGEEDISEKALMILDDPEREFIVSDYLKLELLPKPTFHSNREELEFMETFFDSASEEVDSTPALTLQAIEMASKHNLNAMNALHASAAIQAEVNEWLAGVKI